MVHFVQLDIKVYIMITLRRGLCCNLLNFPKPLTVLAGDIYMSLQSSNATRLQAQLHMLHQMHSCA